MKKRVLYLVLFGIPGLLISGILAFVICGLAAGVLWIFILGDNPWPAFIDTALPVLFGAVFLPAWLACLAGGYFVGKKLERDPKLDKRHILAAIVVTLLPVLLILFQQFSIGALGPKSEGQRCSDFCSRSGYSASSMPPQNSGEKTCSCLDGFGNEVLKVPLEGIDPLK